ncbi:dentin sialophosphoprotein-related [Raphanus sativus]|nr:dentin sialophosphoprotein-related [Raphanus sativus]
MEEQREESESLSDSRVPLEEETVTKEAGDVEKTDAFNENCQMECEGDADVNGAGEEETVGNKVTDEEEANCEVEEDTPGTVLEVSPSAAETCVEEDATTHKEANGEAMDIDYTEEEETVEKVVLDDDAGASLVVPTQDVPIPEADSNASNVVKGIEVDETKDDADMATNPNSSTEDAADPGNIQDHLKTETGNVSLKEDKKAATVVTAEEEVATEEDNAEGVENASNEAHVATQCPEEASDAILGSDENQDEKDQQDTRREGGDTTHEAPSMDQNPQEDTVMEENTGNSDYAEVGTDSDIKTNGVKRKADVLSEEDSLDEGRKTVSLAKVSFAQKPSFKIGDCIARAASQMAGSPSVLKGSNLGDETLSVESFVSQLHSAATDPVKENLVSEMATGFFLDFRNSSASQQYVPEKASSKRGRPSNSNAGGGTEAFEFEEMGDTYWTDRVIHNGGEEQTPAATEKENYQVVPVELKPAQVKKTRRPYRRRQSQISYPLPSASDKPADFDENAPAELIMYFSETDTIPSEKSLSKMFRHFGPIRDSQTEVDEEKNRARVVFRKGGDAEVAYKSAGKPGGRSGISSFLDVVLIQAWFSSGDNNWQSSRREVNDEVALNGMWRLLLVCL